MSDIPEHINPLRDTREPQVLPFDFASLEFPYKPQDLPPQLAQLEMSNGYQRDERDVVAEFKEGMAWHQLTGGSDDPRMIELLARHLPSDKFTKSQIVANGLHKLRLF